MVEHPEYNLLAISGKILANFKNIYLKTIRKIIGKLLKNKNKYILQKISTKYCNFKYIDIY
jgi:hypothetical protein